MLSRNFTGIARGRPVPIPSPGIQVTNISHVRDLSSMLTLAVGKPEAANGSIFNCVSDRGTTFDGLVKMCAKAAGKEAKIVHYDPKAIGVDAKKAFPFRNMVCYPGLPYILVIILGRCPSFCIVCVVPSKRKFCHCYCNFTMKQSSECLLDLLST